MLSEFIILGKIRRLRIYMWIQLNACVPHAEFSPSAYNCLPSIGNFILN